MNDFVAYPSRWRLLAHGLGACGFVAGGLWIVGAFGPAPRPYVYSAAIQMLIGWSCVIFFGMVAAAIVKRLFDTGEQLRIGPNGVRATRWSDQTIPWSEISDVTTWTTHGQKMIVLHLRDPKRFPGHGLSAKLARANSMLTGGDIAVTLVGTDRSYDEAMSAIARFRRGT